MVENKVKLQTNCLEAFLAFLRMIGWTLVLVLIAWPFKLLVWSLCFIGKTIKMIVIGCLLIFADILYNVMKD